MQKKIFNIFLFLIFILIFTDCTHNRKRDSNHSNSRRHAKTEQISTQERSTSKGKVIVQMRKEGGVYHIPCLINGTEMEFIFDTGASDITMSLTEARFLYKQGKLSDNDFVGIQQYQIADGSIREGMSVVLRKVEIGGKTINNIIASIIDNESAPLLLGQSALSKFGKISIDYNRNEITFE